MTKTVTVKYRLSEQGRRAAILAGRPATEVVTEAIETEITAELLAHLTLAPDGTLTLNICGDPRCITLDTPPTDLATLLDARQARAAEAEAAASRSAAAAAAAIEHDRPEVERILIAIAAADPLADLPAGVELGHAGIVTPVLTQDEATRERVHTILRRRNDAHRQALENQQRTEAEAEVARLAAATAEHGGYHWPAAGGMCTFRNYNLWSGGQTRRWVGVFDAPKGIACFLNSPRGEFVWDVTSLRRGDSIQGGGFDCNSRGKRRNESEFFGVVVRNDDTGLVVHVVESRGAALIESHKLRAGGGHA